VRPNCAICGQDILKEDDSEEHIISRAIGGRRAVRGLLHVACNNKAGQTWDAELERQLRPLALHFGVRRQRGRTPRMEIVTTAGEALLLGPGGELSMVRPDINRTPSPEGVRLQVTAGTFEQARAFLESQKRKNPHIDIEETLASAQVRRSYAKGVVQLQLGFGGEQSGRSLVKSALALAHHAGVPIAGCQDALSYLRHVDGTPCFGYYYVGDLVSARPAATPLHCVAVEANPKNGLVLGYTEFFGVHRAVVCLGRGYEGAPVRSVYAIDPRIGEDLDLSVRLDFEAADIEAIYDYRMDDAAGRQEALGQVFGPALQAQQAAERDRVFKEALDYAWVNCGAIRDAMLTPKDMARIAQLFSERAAPWIQHVAGVSEDAARGQAKAFADHILRTA